LQLLLAKESQLTGVMWYKDTPGQQDKKMTDNKGFTSRENLTALSKSVQMMGKLHLDLFCQDKYLLNHVDLKIKLIVPFSASLSTQAMTSLFGSCPKNILL
jgi:hypothetical protein